MKFLRVNFFNLCVVGIVVVSVWVDVVDVVDVVVAYVRVLFINTNGNLIGNLLNVVRLYNVSIVGFDKLNVLVSGKLLVTIFEVVIDDILFVDFFVVVDSMVGGGWEYSKILAFINNKTIILNRNYV